MGAGCRVGVCEMVTMKSPTARTLVLLRRRGYTADVVERFVAGAGERGQGVRRDFLHCIDVIAAKPGAPILGVQATTLANVAARIGKARGRPELRAWLAAGARFEVWGWCRRRGRWVPKIVSLSGADLAAVVTEAPPRKRPRSRWQPADLFGTEG